MTQPIPSKTNGIDRQQSQDAPEQDDPVRKLREKLAEAERLGDGLSPEDRASLEADICLASRSAYFKFYTRLVVTGLLDERAEQELDELFQHAVRVMRPGKFKHSVDARYKEFQCKCHQVRTGGAGAELASTGGFPMG